MVALPSSYRDPSGFVYLEKGVIYRQVNFSYKDDYDRLIQSGLYRNLTEAKLLLPHKEIKPVPGAAYKIIEPQQIAFIFYPYEWCFSQLKAAALTTLEIQLRAVKYSMLLKDASAYNIQFVDSQPVLIDSLSFATYKSGEPWIAYRQFCQHFLAPLALMSYQDANWGQFLRNFIDGIPLPLASKILPKKTWAKIGLLTHIHLHAKSQTHWAAREATVKKRQMSQTALIALIESLHSTIRDLKPPVAAGEWVEYDKTRSYTRTHLDKQKIVVQFLKGKKYQTIWDLGANTGALSRAVASFAQLVVAIDNDPAVVEKNYQLCQKLREYRVLPLVVDLTNPSPGLGWENKEWMSLQERGPADMVLALALIHHLAIVKNIPLSYISQFLRHVSSRLIIEFVPKTDPQVKEMLAYREDIFSHYSQTDFERQFQKHFRILKRKPLAQSQRLLYLMERK